MRRFRPSLVAGALALALSAGTASAQFTNTYIFGDSLSDGGQYGARFTTNPGLTAAMYVGQNFGLSTTPSTQGGTNFAFGGARMTYVARLSADAAHGHRGADLRAGDATAVAADRSTATRSIQIQGGANDVFTLASNPSLTPAQVQAGVTQAALDLAAQAGRLRAAGAQYIIVQNLPDMGKTPAAAAQGQQAQLTAIANLFNSTLNARDRLRRPAGDPVQHVGAAERDHRAAFAVRVREHDDARLHDGRVPSSARPRRCAIRTAISRGCSPTACIRRPAPTWCSRRR